ncbi:sigma-70 family RNA polymerase sigma factor [Chryseobacterium sp. 2987]|uniref:RNA polymerase sigma factor n=1 Tax=Chryseobacterium sp. 2987 TaxID=2817767 RepID=UPI002865E664|nr:sigma-70 family RNA polymerase sigma factor [Chryseobacterium sp. 2987]MDR6919493.1 RNA polymerase sigma-70 factor (ECF subfamily) [Chryseobacterium sp. 2987]
MNKYDENMSHEILLQGLRNGDQYAFHQIFQKFHKAIVFFASKLLFPDTYSQAEEIVQDIFIKMYEKRSSFKSFENIKAFLYISTKNACFDRIAKEKVRLNRFNRYIQNFSESEESILQHIIDSELISQLGAEIEALPEKCRIIMRQFLDDDKTAKEISEDLGITISTVNNQKARAISIIKKRLGSAGIALLLFYS